MRTDDIDAVALLLGNDSAQIREETLDHILAKAPGRKSWHRPLVYRPNLSGAAVRRLARFVAVSLVEVLQQRHEMDDETAAAVVETLRGRLKKGGAALGRTSRKPKKPAPRRSMARAAETGPAACLPTVR